MVKPMLNKPYTPSWHSTDVRKCFELERRRLAEVDNDRLDAAFGAALGQALILIMRSLGAQGVSE